MGKMAKLLNLIVFLAATLLIMGVFYEGQALKWFPIVGILILVVDSLFMISTIINLIIYRKDRKVLIFSIISLILIIIAVVMKVLRIEYPIWTLVFWNFYIWLYYGYLVTRE